MKEFNQKELTLLGFGIALGFVLAGKTWVIAELGSWLFYLILGLLAIPVIVLVAIWGFWIAVGAFFIALRIVTPIAIFVLIYVAVPWIILLFATEGFKEHIPKLLILAAPLIFAIFGAFIYRKWSWPICGLFDFSDLKKTQKNSEKNAS